MERQLAQELGLSNRGHRMAGHQGRLYSQPSRCGSNLRAQAGSAEIAKRERHVRLHLPDLALLLGAPDRVDRLISAQTPAFLLILPRYSLIVPPLAIGYMSPLP